MKAVLFYFQHGRQLKVNLSVVVISGECFLTDTLCEYRNRQTGVGVACKIDSRLVVENVGDSYREGIVGSVEYILLLSELA